MMILERLLAAVSVLLLIGCMIAPLKKTAFAQRNPWVKKIVGCHTLYGVVLLAAAFVHGILAGNKPRKRWQSAEMNTGRKRQLMERRQEKSLNCQ